MDEDWKKSVAEERDKLREEQAPGPEQKQQESPPQALPEPDFRVFLAGLYTQTLVALGELENPVSHTKEKALPEAQFLIDTIDMLRKKTEGNLSAEEGDYLTSLLHDLRMRYVSAAGARPGQ